ncbi:hypothetical protein OpiT1DRAFT_00337 [Opitutaceae bacterium TAV1]|nr:hypothetical protein OpiT1DRAFT_00337 [Opitutaceae bacterium TAV1]
MRLTALPNHIMRKSRLPNYMPEEEADLVKWIEHLLARLADRELRTQLAITDAEFLPLCASFASLEGIIREQFHLQNRVKMLTALKRTILFERQINPPVIAQWGADAGHAQDEQVQGSLLRRIDNMVQRFKRTPAYTLSIGVSLGVERLSSPLRPDWSGERPVLDAVTHGAGGRLHLYWKKRHADRIRIEVKRGDGEGFVFLAESSSSPVVDPHPLPESEARTWTYRGQFVFKNKLVGEPSAPLAVPVLA